MPLLDPIPSPVEFADFAALEWEPLLALVAGFAASPVGRNAILELQPSTDEAWIAQQHQLTGELRLLLDEQTSIPVGGLFDPTQHAAKAQIPGAALEANELQAIARLANDVASWQSLLQSPPARLVGKLSGLCSLSSALTTSLRPLAEIHRAHHPARRLAGRQRLARAGPHPPRAGAPAAPDRRKPARRPAQACRRRRYPGRAHHHSRRPLRHSRPRRAEAARQRRRPRRQLLGANRLHRAAGNHRAEQRTRPPARRRAGRDSPHLRGPHPPGGRLRPRSGRRRARTGPGR